MSGYMVRENVFNSLIKSWHIRVILSDYTACVFQAVDSVAL